MRKILEIGVSLSAERDFNRLLDEILIRVMELTHCDAGTLYLRSGDVLNFKIMRNNTMKTYTGGDGGETNLPPVELERENVCALALIEGRTISIENVRNCKDYDFSGPIRYDEITGYHTESMLVVPMRNRQGEKIGVLQLINALNDDGTVCAFAEDTVLAVESVASQAAIAIQNMRYIEEIKELFHSFVQVMSSAIDERTPYNASHTRHMAEYGERFIDYLNQKSMEAKGRKVFSQNHKEELLMSIWLHDIGKLVTPLEVMNKEARLTPSLYKDIRHRLEIIRLQEKIVRLEGGHSEEERLETFRRIEEAQALIDQANTAGYVGPDLAEKLDELQRYSYQKEDGTKGSWLTGEEYKALTIPKGTLSDEERAIMEEHVVITDKLLSNISFSRELSHVREWAAGHHELLNGSGYPHRLKGDEIPMEIRIISILDIFDALVADDRPYKPGMPIKKALAILTDMAEKEGKLDVNMTHLFIESHCWEGR
ncbi:HD domain-containing phosphohydrolase [Lachnospiraceae bacterium 62-35]